MLPLFVPITIGFIGAGMFTVAWVSTPPRRPRLKITRRRRK